MILYSSTDVQGVLVHYVALTIIVDINEHYYNNVILPDRSNNLNNVFNDENNPIVLWRRGTDRDSGALRKDIDTWTARTKESMIMRIFYNVYRGFYVVCIFYFAPMLYLVLNQYHIMMIMSYDNRHVF